MYRTFVHSPTTTECSVEPIFFVNYFVKKIVYLVDFITIAVSIIIVFFSYSRLTLSCGTCVQKYFIILTNITNGNEWEWKNTCICVYVGFFPTCTDDSGIRPIKLIACDIISIYRILFIVIRTISHANKKRVFEKMSGV